MAEYKRLTKEEKLAKINVALSDAEMASATGGTEEDYPSPKFNVGDRFKILPNIMDGYVTGIIKYCADGWLYNVRELDEEGWFEGVEHERSMEPY